MVVKYAQKESEKYNENYSLPRTDRTHPSRFARHPRWGDDLANAPTSANTTGPGQGWGASHLHWPSMPDGRNCCSDYAQNCELGAAPKSSGTSIPLRVCNWKRCQRYGSFPNASHKCQKQNCKVDISRPFWKWFTVRWSWESSQSWCPIFEVILWFWYAMQGLKPRSICNFLTIFWRSSLVKSS